LPTAKELGEQVLAYVEDISRLRSCAELAAALKQAAEPLGLTGTSCGEVSGPRMANGNPFYFFDWAQDWVGLYTQEHFVATDPVPRWARVSTKPTTWQGLLQFLPPRDPAHRIFDACREFRITDGVIVPVKLGEVTGVVSMGCDRDGFAPHERAFLEVVAAATMMRAVSIVAKPPPTQLDQGVTKRELDCLALLVRGSSDRDIAAKLGISQTTVRFHLENARRKTGATSRTHLAALAVNLGLAQL
jgi:DNA-binding CsgD family transcriptional regulator